MGGIDNGEKIDGAGYQLDSGGTFIGKVGCAVVSFATLSFRCLIARIGSGDNLGESGNPVKRVPDKEMGGTIVVDSIGI